MHFILRDEEIIQVFKFLKLVKFTDLGLNSDSDYVVLSGQ